MNKRTKDHDKRKKVCLGLLIVSLISFLIISIVGLNFLRATKNVFEGTYQSANIKKARNASKILQEGRPISILLLGTDTGALGRHYKGRTDTMIIATINPKTEKITLTSIPRDAQVHIKNGLDPFNKINAAYTIGGPATAIQTVQTLLDVPIDYYILINMHGLEKLVNAVGGVDVVPPLTFKYEDANVVKGKKTHLNGKQALSYVRMRYDDPLGDYGRQIRQKQVITAIIRKSMSTRSLTQYKQLFKTFETNVRTDLTYDDMLMIINNYAVAAHTIKSYVVQGEGQMINGISYQVISAKEKRLNSNRIRRNLGLPISKDTFLNGDQNPIIRPDENNGQNYEYAAQPANQINNQNNGQPTSNQPQTNKSQMKANQSVSQKGQRQLVPAVSQKQPMHHETHHSSGHQIPQQKASNSSTNLHVTTPVTSAVMSSSNATAKTSSSESTPAAKINNQASSTKVS